MERIAIIDHETHQLYVVDISDEALEKYNGEEEDYIKDNYTLSDNWSWDYVVSSGYIPDDNSGPIEIDFNEFVY